MDYKKLNDIDNLLTPFWNDNGYAYEESFLPLLKEGQTADEDLVVSLLYDACEIISVTTASRLETMEQGKDYFLRDGKLIIPASSAVRRMMWDEYHIVGEKEAQAVFGYTGGGKIFFGEGDTMHSRQYLVTYKHCKAWDGYVPAVEASKLPKTKARLKNGEDFTFCWFGDSITTGANSSAAIKSEPFIPMFPELVTIKLQEKYGSNINYINNAMGGATSQWGVDNFDRLYNGLKPDLMFIGYGMNDGSLDPIEVVKNIKTIVKKTLELSPDCEFLICSTTVPNILAAGFFGLQDKHQPYLKALCDELGDCAALVPVTSVHLSLLEKKNFYDMSGNNVNHPNDFLARAHAQTILAQILD